VRLSYFSNDQRVRTSRIYVTHSFDPDHHCHARSRPSGRYPALQRLESLGWELSTDGSPEETRLLAKLVEFTGYLENNQRFIVNCGDRYRHGKQLRRASSGRLL
jgi:hypothetical protein